MDEFFVTVESSPRLLWRLVITSLDHIHIHAGDPLATIRFYESCLGAEHLGSIPFGEGGRNHGVLSLSPSRSCREPMSKPDVSVR